MNNRVSIGACFVFAIALSLVISVGPASAVNASAFLSGTVTNTGMPVAHVAVVAVGNNATQTAETDDRGRFSFAPLTVGAYTLSVHSGNLTGRQRVDLGNGGAIVAIAIGELKTIGSTVVSRARISRGSGSDVTLNATDLTQMPFGNNFAEMEIQQPGAVRGANGVVHINGDHGVINYTVDGVQLPQELNRDIGGEINLNDLSFVDLIEGAYPAQYGLRFGSVFNISTRAGTGPAGFDGYSSYGSYGDLQSTVGYHAPLGHGGGLQLDLSGLQSTRGLDPPNLSSPHNRTSDVGQLLRITLPAGDRDFTNVTIINNSTSFQIPNDVDNGEPATTDDSESQADTFVSAQYHHTLGTTGVVSFGPSYKVSRIQDFGDPTNDFAYGKALNVEAAPFGNGGASTDCATSYTPGTISSTFTPTTCGFSLADTRTAVDYIAQSDYTQKFGNHEIAAGVAYDHSRVLKHYAVTLQPDNFLSPVKTPASPLAPITVTDNSPNNVNTYTSYLQDSWHLSPHWQADYGIRYDFFNLQSTNVAQGFGGVSPRVKITHFFGPRASLYGYLGRFFEPFSYENVSPQAAQLLNLPLQPSVAQFDLQPERDTQLEFGGHLPVGSGDLGFRVWQKNANNLIDDTQVGVTLLHQDINYGLGRLSQEALNFQQPLLRNGRAYVEVAHVISLNRGCETQLLAPCFGAPDIYTPADHEQRWSVASGVLFNDHHGGWFSADGEYGSGLSSGICSPADDDCKQTPHITLNVEKGFHIAPKTALTLDASNILNDRYFVTLLNAQGNHVAPPRQFNVGIRLTP